MEIITEQTLCLIKPDAVRAHREKEIMQLIELDGFHILEKRQMQLSQSHVMEFYSEHVGKSFFPKLQSLMTSGPILALILAKTDAIGAWRALMGPTNSETARETAPSTLRALYGTDGTENAMHGSDSPQSAQREIKFFFPHREVAQPSADTKPVIPKSLGDALCKGLTDLAKQKPSHDPTTAIIWLGEWLLQHNPNKPLVYGPDELSLDELDDGAEFAEYLPEQAAEQVDAMAEVDGPGHDHTECQVQHTLAMIKPDAVAAGNAQSIIDRIEDAGFRILRRRYYTLYPAQAQVFYAEHSGKLFFEELVEFMTSGPIWALEIEGVDGITGWRSLMGPTNTLTAAQDAPESIRAQFGTDGTKNATHGSDSAESAAREITFHFPPVEMTLAMIKPDAVSAGAADTIMERVEQQGFKIMQKTSYQLTQEQAEEFYSDHVGKPFFSRLVEFMTSGPIWALTLEMPGAIAAWRAMMGPTNSALAKATASTTLRAQFGTDSTMNAVHGSDSPESAAREIEFHFQAHSRHKPPADTAVADDQPGDLVANIATNIKTEEELAEEEAAAVTVQAAVRGRQARQRVGRLQEDPQVANDGSNDAIAVNKRLAIEEITYGKNDVPFPDSHAGDAPGGLCEHGSIDNGDFHGDKHTSAADMGTPGPAEENETQPSSNTADGSSALPEEATDAAGSTDEATNTASAPTDLAHEEATFGQAATGTPLDNSTQVTVQAEGVEAAGSAAESDNQP